MSETEQTPVAKETEETKTTTAAEVAAEGSTEEEEVAKVPVREKIMAPVEAAPGSFLAIAQQRQSVRAYDTARPVEREKLVACLEAARLAPSACNAQPYHFHVATGATAARVGRCCRTALLGQNLFATAVPAFVVVSEAPYNLTAGIGARLKGQDYRLEDIGIAVAYFTAEAVSQGLATCIMGWFDQRGLQDVLGITAAVRLVLAVGYARPGTVLRAKVRKTMDTLVTWCDDGDDANKKEEEKDEEKKEEEKEQKKEEKKEEEGEK